MNFDKNQFSIYPIFSPFREDMPKAPKAIKGCQEAKENFAPNILERENVNYLFWKVKGKKLQELIRSILQIELNIQSTSFNLSRRIKLQETCSSHDQAFLLGSAHPMITATRV